MAAVRRIQRLPHSEDAHLGRLEILSTSVSGGHLECRSRSVARTQKLSPAMILANSAILSKIVRLIGASRRVPPRRIPPPQTFRDHLYLYGFIVQIQASADSRQSSDFDHNFRNFACSRMPDMIMRLSQRCSKPLRPGLHRQVPHQAGPH